MFYVTTKTNKEVQTLKTEKINTEIEKTKAKIAEDQARLRELERQKTEQENTEIVGIVRDVKMSPQELAAFVRKFKEDKEVSCNEEN
jgi:DNA-binding transcriptional regulator YhcF (GntR family)